MVTSWLWFETHSSTTDNADRVATGWLPGELSALGREQAAALGDRIAGRALSAILTSDLRRATELDGATAPSGSPPGPE